MKIIQELAGAFVDAKVGSDDYLFSYRNTQDEIIDFYEKKMVLKLDQGTNNMEYASVTNVDLDNTVKSPECQWINISTGDYSAKVLIDRYDGKFLDIFPLYRFISRRVYMARR